MLFTENRLLQTTDYPLPTNMKSFAQTISNLLSPALTIPAVILVFLSQPQISFGERWSSILLFIFGGVIPIACALIVLKKLGKISDWELQKRKERYLLNAAILTISLVVLILALAMHLFIFSRFFLILFVWFGIFTLITYFWKISGHTSSYTLLYLTLIPYGFVFQLLGLLLLISLIWSRIVLKHHTLAQALGGVVLSVVVYSAGIYLQII